MITQIFNLKKMTSWICLFTGIVINGSTEICPLKTLLTLHSSSEQGYSEVRGRWERLLGFLMFIISFQTSQQTLKQL